jgi:hypothetical protein
VEMGAGRTLFVVMVILVKIVRQDGFPLVVGSRYS